MKRLLAIFLFLLLVTSCTKETDISLCGDGSNNVVSFTASLVSTRATLINSWTGGEEVALFIGETLYPYTVAADGTMLGDDVVINTTIENTYTSFYPYDSNLSTIEEYEAACTAGNVDYMSAVATTSSKDVALQFSHQMAALSFTITIEGTITDPIISLALDGDFSSAVTLEYKTTTSSVDSKLVANYFVDAGTDISSTIIKLEYSGTTTLLSIKREESNTLEAGKQYSFSLMINADND